MTREVYDKVCATLTSYEHPEEFDSFDEYNSFNWEEVFYNLLVEVQNDSEYA